MSVRTIGYQERRARLGWRHHLAGSADSPVDVAASLVGMHATDPAGVYVAMRARLDGDALGKVQRELYEERRLLRMLGMRRTMWVVPTTLAPTVYAGAAFGVAARMRRRLVGELTKSAVGGNDPARWLVELEDAVLAALEKRGEAVGSQLATDEPGLRTRTSYAEGKSYGGPVNLTSRVLNLMSADGRIARGRPRGTWVSSQYVWSPLTDWLPEGPGDRPRDDAQVELAERWLRAFGPATVADLTWWTGWTGTEVERALAALEIVEVDMEGAPGVLLADDVERVAAPPPWVALLPALDPTALGWKERGWYLSEEARAVLFDRSGNVGPTVWADGRIVGGWGQRPDGTVVHRLLEDVGVSVAAAVEAEAERLTAWFDGVRPTPRFRTPLERELSA